MKSDYEDEIRAYGEKMYDAGRHFERIIRRSEMLEQMGMMSREDTAREQPSESVERQSGPTSGISEKPKARAGHTRIPANGRPAMQVVVLDALQASDAPLNIDEIHARLTRVYPEATRRQALQVMMTLNANQRVTRVDAGVYRIKETNLVLHPQAVNLRQESV